MRVQHLTAVAAVLVCAALVVSGCVGAKGSGNVVTEERSVGDVSRVQVTGIGRLEVTQGSPAKLTVEADDNLMRYIKTETVGDRLVISVEGPGVPFALVNPTRTIVYRLQVSDPRSLQLSGSGEIAATSLDVSRLELEISGSGKADLGDLKADTFTYRLSGSGKADISGEVDREEVTVSGSGRLTAGDLKASEADVTISGSGDATLWATDKLDVTISGSGTVRYYGSPAISQRVSGSGNLKSLGTK